MKYLEKSKTSDGLNSYTFWFNEKELDIIIELLRMGIRVTPRSNEFKSFLGRSKGMLRTIRHVYEGRINPERVQSMTPTPSVGE